MIDSDGEIPSFVLRVLIHNAVCVDIMATVPGMIGGVGMKVNYDTATNGKMYGYMDLVNIYTLEAYEVKRVGLSIDNAINQLNDYIRNTWVGFRQYFPAKKEEEEENLKIPKLHQGTNPLIKGSFSFMEYYVEYWYERDGIILYDYYPLPQPQEQPQEERARKKANLPILNETVESISWMEIGVAFATAFAFGIALGGCGNLKTQTCLAN